MLVDYWDNKGVMKLQDRMIKLWDEYALSYPENIRVMCEYNPIDMYYSVWIFAPEVGVEIKDTTKEIDDIFIEKVVGTVSSLLKGGASNGRKDSQI